jgi:Domain of unknown function (DUF4406)
MKKKAYISGKITGMEERAKELFEQAEKELLEMGYEPVNPMKLNHQHDLSWEAYMKEDIKALCGCDSVYLLRNYADSKGALLELAIATELKMSIIYQH